MANISVSLPSDGETIDAADYNTPINTIVNEINGNLDNSNIDSAAAISGSKLADDAVTATKINFGGSGSGVWWEEIGRTTLGSAGDTITVSSLPARKHLLIKVLLIATGGTNNTSFTLNGDTGSNYSQTTPDLASGGVQSTNTSNSYLLLENGSPASGAVLYGEITLVNVATQHKVIHWENAHVVASAATAPTVSIAWGKWSNATDAVSSLTFTNGGSGDFAAGSEVVVLGHD